MKKGWKVAIGLVAVAGIMSGCITTSIVMAKLAADEKAEIISGKVFTIEKATVTYQDGRILNFIDNGKFIRIDDSREHKLILINPDSAFVCDTWAKTYSSILNNNGTAYYSNLSLVFPPHWIDLHRFAGALVSDEKTSADKLTVAGKWCTCYTRNGYVCAGWERVMLYREDNGNVLLKAIQFNESGHADYELPAGYRCVGHTIEFAEDF